MAITTYDIAQKLGISQSTVSRILNGVQGYRVAETTRLRVLDAARQMGYRPNSIARSLRKRRTNIVGFYSGYGYLNARNAYIASVIGALQQACDAEKLDILLHGAFRQRTTDDVLGELVDGRIDGLFLHTLSTDPLVELLVESSLPVVAISDALPGLASVVADDRDGIRQTIEYLFARGHRRVAYLAPEPRFVSVENRVDAFLREMHARGERDARVIRNQGVELDISPPHLLEMAGSPTAICCWNDLTAANLLVSCRKFGIRVPTDLAVVGFDGVLNSRLMAQALTTVAVPWDFLGQQAVALLLSQIRGNEVPRETCVPVRLVCGETT
ncbi:MAG: transcriptional regulator, LacI family [Chthonomonadaceae bacterium]|nr:transcriptional regulator, LacI family [Chthonomonadaceae bacterium]